MLISISKRFHSSLFSEHGGLFVSRRNFYKYLVRTPENGTCQFIRIEMFKISNLE